MKEILDEITSYHLYSDVREQKSLLELYLKDHKYTEIVILPFDRYLEVYNQVFVSYQSDIKFIPKWEQVYISRCYQLLELKLLRENNIRAKEDNYLRYLINSNLAKMLYSMAETIIRNRNTNYYTKILLPNIGVFSSYIDNLETLDIVGLFKISFSSMDFKIVR